MRRFRLRIKKANDEQGKVQLPLDREERNIRIAKYIFKKQESASPEASLRIASSKYFGYAKYKSLLGGKMSVKKVFSFVALFMVLVSSINAQPDITYKGSLYNHGFFKDSWVAGTHLYTVTERELMIYSISDTTNPVLLSTLETPGKAQAVRTSGNYAYVLDEGTGLLVINISNPYVPVVTDTLDLGSHPFPFDVADRMQIVGNYLYVSRYYGLKIFSIFNPAAPIARDSIFLTPSVVNNVEDFVVSGNYAYISQNSDSGIYIINVSDPDSIFAVKHFYTGSHTEGIEIKDSILYAAGSYPDGLRILNIADPLNPVPIGFYIPQQYYTLYDVKIVDTLAYCYRHGGGLLILNVKDPTSPDSVAFPLCYGGGEGIIDRFNNLLLMTSGYSGISGYAYTLNLLNISDRLNPSTYSSISTDQGPIEGVGAYGSKLVVLNIGELLAHDISDPTTPVFLGKYSDAAADPYKVAVGPKYMYYLRNWQKIEVRAISLKDYSLVATFPRTQNSYFMDIIYSKGNLIAKRDTLFIFDDTLHVVGSCPDTGATQRIYVRGDSVYGHNETTGNFNIYDISDRTNPILVGSYPGNPYMNYDFVVVDSLAYFLYAYGNLSYVKSYRRDNSLGMVGVDSIALEKNMAYRIESQGKYLYVSTYEYLITIRINPDNSMTEVSRYNTSGKPVEMATHGQYCYLGDTYSVGIYEFPISLAPEIVSKPDTFVNEDSTYECVAFASGSPLSSYSLVTHPAGMTIDSVSGEMNWVPDNSRVGDTVVSFIAVNTVSADTLSFNLHILNTPPHFTSVPDTEAAFPESTYTYDANSDDEGQGNTFYSAITLPSWLAIDSLTGVLSGNLPDTSVNAMVSIKVDDGNGGVDTQSFVIGFVAVEEKVDSIPTAFKLSSTSPNPFTKGINIRYALPKNSKVNLSVYNICGQNVATLVNGVRMLGTIM